MNRWRWIFWPAEFIFALGLESAVHRLMEQGHWREATQVYERLLQGSPHRATFHTESGLAHLMLNEWEPAEDRFRDAIRLDPLGLRAYDLLAILLANQGSQSEAEKTWNEMIAAARRLASRRPLLYSRFSVARIEEAREKIVHLREETFAGFPIPSGYEDNSFTTPVLE